MTAELTYMLEHLRVGERALVRMYRAANWSKQHCVLVGCLAHLVQPTPKQHMQIPRHLLWRLPFWVATSICSGSAIAVYCRGTAKTISGVLSSLPQIYTAVLFMKFVLSETGLFELCQPNASDSAV